MPTDPRIRLTAGESAADAMAQLDEAFGAPINAASPTPVDYLAEARDTLDGAPIGELDRLAHAAGELYGTALRDQLHRAIEAVVLSLAAANRSLTRGRYQRDDDLTRLHGAVDQWAVDYRRIDTAYQQAADALARTGADLERTAAELADAERRIAGIILAAGEPATEPQPATPPAMPEANLGVARTRDLLAELATRLDEAAEWGWAELPALVASLRAAGVELPAHVVDYRPFDQ